MKNVAATKGHRVSFAEFFLVLEMTREGKFAGTDMLLNFYRCPPKRNSWPALREFLRVAIEEYKVCTCMQQKNASARIFFRRRVGRLERKLCSSAEAAPPVLNFAGLPRPILQSGDSLA
jgi:hypothetical protein